MNSISLGATSSIRIGFSGSADEQQVVCLPAHTPIINTNLLSFIISAVMLFTLWNCDHLSANFKTWLFVGSCLSSAIVRMYESYYQVEAHIQAKKLAVHSLLGQTELRLRLSPSQTYVTRARLHELRIQHALLERELAALADHATATAVCVRYAPRVPLMSEDEINALPVYEYKVIDHQSETSEASSSSGPKEDELICNICLEEIERGELVRSLPCLHQFHANCIDPWLRRRGSCPICKITVVSGQQQSLEEWTS